MRRHFFLALLIACGAHAADAVSDPLLLISIDGLHPDYVTKADEFGLKIPALREMLRTGSYATGVVGVVPTVTYPSHTTMVTGVAPSKHGIYSNTTFDPTGVNRDGWYWYAEDIKTPTLWQAAHAAKLRTASVNWPVTVGDDAIDFLFPEYWRTSTGDDKKLMRALAKPTGVLAKYESDLGPFVDGNTETLESDRVRAKFALQLIREHKPDFIAVHLIALDGIEHHDGPFLPSSFATLEALDGMIAALREAALGANPRTITAIVSDHGFQATHSAVNLRVPFVEHGLIKLKPAKENTASSVEAWDAQVWSGGAVAAVQLRDRNDAGTRVKVEKVLASLKEQPKNGIAKILSREDLGDRGFPDADWLVEFEPGFYLGAELRGTLIAPATSKGTHGYMPERQQMHASLFMSGADVRAANLGVIDMRQLAPTFAQVLGVRFTTADQPALDIRERSHE